MMSRLDRDILRFLVVGVGSNVANFLTYFFLLFIHVPVFAAAVCGYALGLLCSYHFGRTWVFGRRFDVDVVGGGRFLLVYAVGGAGMTTITTALVDGLMFHYALGWVFGAGFATCSNFVGLRWLVFRPATAPREYGESCR